MQQPQSTASTGRPVVTSADVKVAVRSSGGDGSRVIVVEVPAFGTVADMKQLLCRPPHSMCCDASALELALKGEGAWRYTSRLTCI
jgi:hypothetical protein